MTTTPHDYAVELAETALQRLTDVRINGREPIETRINPADYDEIIAYHNASGYYPTRLWGVPFKADAKVPPGAPRILIRAVKP